MNDQALFKRIATSTTILTAPEGPGNLVLPGMTVDYSMDTVSYFSDVINLGATAAGPLHSSCLAADYFGNLLPIPFSYNLGRGLGEVASKPLMGGLGEKLERIIGALIFAGLFISWCGLITGGVLIRPLKQSALVVPA